MSHALLLRCHISHPYPDYQRIPGTCLCYRCLSLASGTVSGFPQCSDYHQSPIENYGTRLWDALSHLTLPLLLVGRLHIWASASRPIPSAFRFPAAQSGTGAFRYQTGPPYFATGLVSASAVIFVPIPYRTDRRPDIPSIQHEKNYTKKKRNTGAHLHVCTAVLERDTPCMSYYRR